MTDYADSQAEESLGENEEIDDHDLINKNIDDSEEEEDGEDMDKDLEDLIDDNVIEDEASSEEEKDGPGDDEHKKRKKKKNMSDAELEDEDYDLIEENLGIKVKRKKFRRIRMDSEGDSGGEGAVSNKKSDSKQMISDQIFENESVSDVEHTNSMSKPKKHGPKEILSEFAEPLDEEDEEYIENPDEIDDMDDFIVDEDDGDQPSGTASRKSKKHQRFLAAKLSHKTGGRQTSQQRDYYRDDTLQQAQDVFGCDFDFGDLERFNEESGDELDEADLDEDELDQDEIDGEIEEDLEGLDEEQRAARKKKGKKVRGLRKKEGGKTSGKSKRIDPEAWFEPAELERRHMTYQDALLRSQDAPERFLTRPSHPVSAPLTDTELQDEADWIFERAFSTYPISSQEIPSTLTATANPKTQENEGYVDYDAVTKDPIAQSSAEQDEFYKSCHVGLDVNYTLKPVTAIAKIREILNFIRNQGLEVPFIAHYRKEYFEPDLTVADLWKIYHWDERWINLRDKRNNLINSMEMVKEFLDNLSFSNTSHNSDYLTNNPTLLAITREDIPPLTEIDVIKVKALKSAEEFEDMKQWFTTHYTPILRYVRLLEKQKLRREALKSKGLKSKSGASADAGNIFDALNESGQNETTQNNNNENVNLTAGTANVVEDLENQLLNDPKHMEDNEVSEEKEPTAQNLKKPKKVSAYTAFLNAGIGRAVTKFFGINAAQLGENVRDNYQKYEIAQTQLDFGRAFGRSTLEDILKNELIPKKENETAYQGACTDAIYELDLFLARLKQMQKDEEQANKNNANEYHTTLSDESLAQEALMKAARHVFALRLARDPQIRKSVRTVFYDRAKINVRPSFSQSTSHSTTNGTKSEEQQAMNVKVAGTEENLMSLLEDETHPLYTSKYLKDKPIRDLYNDQFLKLQWGAEQGFIRMDLGMTPADHASFLDELRPLIEKDEYGIITRTWNEQRTLALGQALTKHLYPLFAEELRQKLLREAADCVLNNYAYKLYSALKIGPYQCESGLLPEGEGQDGAEIDSVHRARLEAVRQSVNRSAVGKGAKEGPQGVRVLGLAYTLAHSPTPGLDLGGAAVVCDRAGQVIATLRLPNILKNKRSHFSARDRSLKEEELGRLRAFISSHRPQVIAIGTCEASRLCLSLREDLKDICLDLEQTLENFPPVAVILVDEDVATIVQQRVSTREDLLQQASNNTTSATSKAKIQGVVGAKPSELYAKATHSLAGKAASLARRVQDPLLEFSQLFPDSSPSSTLDDNDIFSLKYEAMQDTLLNLRNLSATHGVSSSGLKNSHSSQKNNDIGMSGIGFYFDVLPTGERDDHMTKARNQLENLSLSKHPNTTALTPNETGNSVFAPDLHRVALQIFVDRVNDVGVDLNKLLAIYETRQQTVVGSGNANAFGVAADELAQSLNLAGANGTSGTLSIITSANCVAQFISGLGPRKGAALLKLLEKRQHTLKAQAGFGSSLTTGLGGILGITAPLQNRTQLVTVCGMGPKVFINSAGFIKLDTTALALAEEEGKIGAQDYYLEILDSTRIHPETYEWARKMAVDALEYDEEDEQLLQQRQLNIDTESDDNSESDNNADSNKSRAKKKKSKKAAQKGPLDPASALEAIVESPDKLKDLDLDAFAEELTRQGFGQKTATLYDIRSELTHRYKDTRVPPMEPTLEERFNMVTKETPYTFYIGRMLPAKVFGIAYVNPKKALEKLAANAEQNGYDAAADKIYNPVRNEETGLWGCPICFRSDFTELSEVWQHYDSELCPGQPVGIKVRLDNGLNGFVHIKNISDKTIKNPEERVKIGMTIHGRIIKIDIERFSVEMTTKSSDLADSNGEYRPPKDNYYDYVSEQNDMQRITEQAKNAQLLLKKNAGRAAAQMICKRVISHPSFKNVTFHQAQKILETQLGPGEALIRPSSSKGNDHLTLTWKIVDSIYQHIDIKEEGKDKPFTLGKSLWIGNEEFEDLDEILARFVMPMAALARDITTHKYYFNERFGPNGDKEIQDVVDDDEIKRSMDVTLRETKRAMPSRIPYAFYVSKDFPGKFVLAYTPRQNTHFEYVTTTPQGLRYRGRMFTSLNSLIHWFKEHFRELPTPTLLMPNPATQNQIQNVSNTAYSGQEIDNTPHYNQSYDNYQTTNQGGQQYYDANQQPSQHQQLPPPGIQVAAHTPASYQPPGGPGYQTGVPATPSYSTYNQQPNAQQTSLAYPQQYQPLTNNNNQYVDNNNNQYPNTNAPPSTYQPQTYQQQPQQAPGASNDAFWNQFNATLGQTQPGLVNNATLAPGGSSYNTNYQQGNVLNQNAVPGTPMYGSSASNTYQPMQNNQQYQQQQMMPQTPLMTNQTASGYYTPATPLFPANNNNNNYNMNDGRQPHQQYQQSNPNQLMQHQQQYQGGAPPMTPSASSYTTPAWSANTGY